MRKKLDTRFPAARIKKIMQVDEEVGKIALSTPVLVSKALELFLQDLLDRTYGVMRDRGSKTLNSGHLKLCLEHFKEYDFLKDLASNIADTAPETPRSGPSLDGPGGTSMTRGRRKRPDGEEEHEDSGDNSRRGHKVKRESSGLMSPPSGDFAAAGRSSMKRQSSTSSTRSMEPVELQPVFLCEKKLKEDPKPIAEEPKLEENGGTSKAAGFDLNFDLNASPDLEESPVRPLPPVQKAVCDSDDDYDAE